MSPVATIFDHVPLTVSNFSNELKLYIYYLDIEVFPPNKYTSLPITANLE